MTFIQRSKKVPPPVIETHPRRLRFTSANTAATRALKAGVARTEIDELLQVVAESDRAIDEAVATNEVAYKAIEKLLRDNNLSSHSDGVYTAEIVEQFSRQSRTVDPKKFRAHVDSDMFWAAIKVNLGEAEKLLTEKELNSISDVVPSKSMGHCFKLKRSERKVRKV